MKIKTKQYAQALFESYEESKAEQRDNIISNFVDILYHNNDLHLIDRILVDFSELWNRNKNIIKAEISSAHQIGDKTEDYLISKIKDLAKAKDVDIKKVIDKKIIGGVVIKYGDKILDSSMLSRIKRLQEEFSK